jgi:hypothetical protein
LSVEPHAEFVIQDSFLAAALPSQLFDPVSEELGKPEVAEIRRFQKWRDTPFTGARALEEKLIGAAKLWIDLARAPQSRRQEQKWRGWYLVPEHGALTMSKLRELQRMLVALVGLARRGAVAVDTSDAGVKNANALLRGAGVSYAHSYSDREKRDLFIRQQKNYLLRLGLVVETTQNELVLTNSGTSWIGLESDGRLSSAFRDSMLEIRWSWCSRPFLGLAVDAATSLGGELRYRELHNWLIHATDEWHAEELTTVIRQYRELGSSGRARVDDAIDDHLEKTLTTFVSSTAFGHYKAKIRDLMSAFATTSLFRVRGAGPEDLTLLSRSRAQAES